MIKREIRVLGIAFASLHLRNMASIQVVGVVYRGSLWLEGVMRTVISRGRTNLTPDIAKMVVKSPHYPQLRVIVLDKFTTQCGNYIDIKALSRKTRLPVVAVLRRRIPIPRFSETGTGHGGAGKAFARLPYTKWRSSGRTYSVYHAGLSGIDLNELLEVCASKEGAPEAARVARIAASSLETLAREP
jgi:endonuclease V-like protein UPF0215 family